MTRPFDIQGHRGARALFPENTLEGFLAAYALGITAFELDVGMTADGVIVVAHDPALNPDITRDASGAWLNKSGPAIWALSYDQLRAYDVGRIRPGSLTWLRFRGQLARDGARIPTLEMVLAGLPGASFTIEVKTDPVYPDRTAPPQIMTDATLRVIDACNAGQRVIMESFDWRVQRHVRAIRPDIKLAWLTSKETIRHSAIWWDGITPRGSIPEAVAAEGGPIWAPDHSDLTEALVQEAHARGLSVLPWTVNYPRDMRRLIGWGVDGLISDRPDVAMKIVTETIQTSPVGHSRQPHSP
jgi:glycerophosphoryl diester phosphodiesterase